MLKRCNTRALILESQDEKGRDEKKPVYPVYYGCATWEGELENILPYRRVHFWHFALQKGAFLASKTPVDP